MTDSWPMDWPITVDKSTLDQYVVQVAEGYAEMALRMLTLQRVGGLPVTVEPCGGCQNLNLHANPFPAGPGFHPYLTDTGQYANCFCGSGCSCSAAAGLYLAPPVGRVDSVVVNGQVLSPAAYRVEGSTLVRTDGFHWPSCGRTRVTYLQAYPVDVTGRFVGGMLAHEFYKALTDGKKCRLPEGVTSIARAGLTMQVAQGIFPDGNTGIREVDMYVRQWNPNSLKVRPTVWSPDLEEGRIVG